MSILDPKLKSPLPSISTLPLSFLAAVAATLYLLLNRVPFWMSGTLSSRAIANVGLAAKWLNYLGLLAGAVAMITATFHLLTHHGFAQAGRRLFLAISQCALVIAIVLLMLTPRAHTSPYLIVYTAVLTHVVVIFRGLLTLRHPLKISALLTLAFATVISCIGLCTVGFAFSSPSVHPVGYQALAQLLGYIAEPFYLAMIVMALPALWFEKRGLRGHLQRALACALGLFVASLMFTLMRDKKTYDVLIYGLQRMTWVAPLGPVIALGLSVAWVSAFDSNAESSQMSLGVILWISAGILPLSPSKMMYWALGTVLFARGAWGVGAHPKNEPLKRVSRR